MKKVYFGREEFQLMVKQALADTIHHGRKVTLQKLAIVGLGFIIGLWPGSIGPSEKLYEEHGKVSPSFFLFFSFLFLTNVSSVSQDTGCRSVSTQANVLAGPCSDLALQGKPPPYFTTPSLINVFVRAITIPSMPWRGALCSNQSRTGTTLHSMSHFGWSCIFLSTVPFEMSMWVFSFHSRKPFWCSVTD